MSSWLVDHDDRLSSVALLTLVPYFFAHCILGGFEILPVALELQSTTPSLFLLLVNDLSQPTCTGFEIYAQLLRNTQFAVPAIHAFRLAKSVETWCMLYGTAGPAGIFDSFPNVKKGSISASISVKPEMIETGIVHRWRAENGWY